MKLNMKSILKIGLLFASLMAGPFRAQALDGAVVIANSSVAADSLSAEALKDIYTAKTKYWADGQPIVIIVLPDQTDAALQQASGMNGSQFKTFWQRLTFSGRGSEPKKADNTASLVALVAATKGAIALAPTDAVLKGVKTMESK
jgi:ABC-type phosphate transport system substrate-binding protein